MQLLKVIIYFIEKPNSLLSHFQISKIVKYASFSGAKESALVASVFKSHGHTMSFILQVWSFLFQNPNLSPISTTTQFLGPQSAEKVRYRARQLNSETTNVPNQAPVLIINWTALNV